MNETKTRAMQLLDKVYDRLDAIDVNKLTMNDLKDFLEVVQKGQFLESFGSTSALGFGGSNWPVCSTRPSATETGEGTVE